MKNIFIIIALLFILLPVISNTNLHAQDKPIQLALFNPIQIFPENTSITGLRFSLLYGKNARVNGVDLGLVNFTSSDQLGIQWGAVGYTEGNFTGWQSNWVSITKGQFVGLQSGVVTYNSSKVSGLQFAVVNYAATMNGLQIGLVNIIGEGGFLPVFPFFNFSFD